MLKKGLFLLTVGIVLAAFSAGAQQKQQQQARPKAKPLEEQVTGQGYGMAGCGLGSIVFGEKPGMIQVIAATLNGTAGSQTFGITSGTSNCLDEGSSKKEASLFIEVNRHALNKDVSRGSGETVASLSQIMGCKDSKQFGKVMQMNFEKIFLNDQSSSEQMINSIEKAIREDKTLNVSCGHLS